VNLYRRTIAPALLLAALLSLAVPAWAAAAEFEVTGTGDSGTQVACETKVGECTLRGAFEAANAGASEDEIIFASSFDGGAGSTIALGSQLTATQPVKIIGDSCGGNPCVTLQRSSGKAIFIQTTHATVEGLAIEVGSGSIGIQIISGEGARIVGNTVTVNGEGTSAAIESNGSTVGGAGNLIEGNTIAVAFGFNFGIALQNGPNRIFGNEIQGSGCCYAGVWLELNAGGNRIGGDTAASENLIGGYSGDAIHSTSGSLRNEVGRNHGQNGGQFIAGSPTAAPTITEAFPSSVAGSAEPGAEVRVFRKATEGAGEIEGFLGETEADGATGAWEVTFAKVPIGTLVGATQTVTGATSGLGATATLVESPAEKAEKEREQREKEEAEKEQQEKEEAEKEAAEKEAAEKEQREKEAAEKAVKEREAAEKATRERQEKEAREQREREAKEKEGGSGGGDSGGGSAGGSGSGGPTTPAPTAPAPAPVVVAPKVKITAGPKRTSASPVARFRFRAEPATGATFECRLDGGKWAACRAPKAYKKLKPGSHTFRVRASAGGNRGPAATLKFLVRRPPR
jgi:outer membrane biosynthesis protein TonB